MDGQFGSIGTRVNAVRSLEFLGHMRMQLHSLPGGHLVVQEAVDEGMPELVGEPLACDFANNAGVERLVHQVEGLNSGIRSGNRLQLLVFEPITQD